MEQLTKLWWFSLPKYTLRVSKSLTTIVTDGMYLYAFKRLRAVAPIIALLLGFVIGWQQLTFDRVFSESLWVLLIVVVIGIISGQLGLMFLVGFIFGDFFFAHPEWEYRRNLLNGIRLVRIPLLIQYGLLSIPLTSLAITTKTLVFQLKPSPEWSRNTRIGLATGGYLVFTLLLVYLWIQIVPILIRPTFTWLNTTPPVSAMIILQQGNLPIMVAAGLAALLRIGLQVATATHPPFVESIDEYHEKLNLPQNKVPLVERIPLVIRLLISATWATLLLAGMFQAWWDGFIIGSVMFLTLAARYQLLPIFPSTIANFTERIPVLMRLVLGGILVLIASRIALGEQFVRSTDSFRVILGLTIGTILIFYLLFPRIPSQQDEVTV